MSLPLHCQARGEQGNTGSWIALLCSPKVVWGVLFHLPPPADSFGYHTSTSRLSFPRANINNKADTLDEANPMAHKEPAKGRNAPRYNGHVFNSCTFNKEAHISDLTDPPAHQEPAEGYNFIRNVENTFNACSFTVVDKRKALLEWLSPLEPGQTHWAMSIDRVAGVGDWLLLTNQFTQWREGDDGSAKPVLFCHGDPGVGKTYLRYGLLASLGA